MLFYVIAVQSTQHNTTQHNTTQPIIIASDNKKIRVTVIGSVINCFSVANSLSNSKNYICDTAIIGNYYGKNFWRTFFSISVKEKVKLIFYTAQTHYRARNIKKKRIRNKYFNFENTQYRTLETIPAKIFDETDIFLLACNDSSQFKTSDYASWLMQNGVSKRKIFVLPDFGPNTEIPVLEDEKLSGLCRNITEVKPVLRHLEYHVTDFCNLKCKGCTHLANYVNNLGFYSVEKFRAVLEKMKEKFSAITTIFLMGGEPLLCKNLHECVYAAHEVFPYAAVKIVTNGLLYNNITPPMIEAFKKVGVAIEISQYPPTIEVIDKIISFCEKNELNIMFRKPIKEFYKRVVSDKNADYRKIWCKCSSKHCHILHGTEFFPCPQSWTIQDENFKGFDDKEDVDKTESSEYSFDFAKDISDDGWDILMKIETPLKVCKKCGDKEIFFKWESEA